MPSLGCSWSVHAPGAGADVAPRVRWLLLATGTIATTGIWVMHFVACSAHDPGRPLHSVPVTRAVVLIAVSWWAPAC